MPTTPPPAPDPGDADTEIDNDPMMGGGDDDLIDLINPDD